VGVVGLLSGAAGFLPHWGQMVLVSGSGVPQSVQKYMGVDCLRGGIWVGVFYVRKGC
jgi:hypothetical protein